MKVLAVFLSLVLVGATLADYHHHGSGHPCQAVANSDWILSEDLQAAASHHVQFKVAFKKQNLDTLAGLHDQISDYYSPMFGKHLSNEQIKNLVSLPEAEIAEVESYFMEESGKFCEVNVQRSIHQDYLYVSTCAAQAAALFPRLDLAVFKKATTGHLILRHRILIDPGHNMDLLGFPAELSENIEAILDLTDLPAHHSRATKKQNGTFNPSQGWQPDVKEQTVNTMIEFFGITYDDIKDASYEVDHPQVRQGVIEFDNAPFSAAGLAEFQKTYHVPLNPVRKVVGTEESYGESIEANLDFQTITAISGKAQTWDFVFGATASFQDVIETILNTEGAPKVFSSSWGGNDSDYSKTTAELVNNDFMKLGLTGTTCFFDSGDSGPTLSNSCNTFEPRFPIGSPYLVAVGGMVQDKDGQLKTWEHSSGGFSGYIPRPSYQNKSVEAYLKTPQFPANPAGKIYTTTGRAYPDIAGFGAFEPVFDGVNHSIPIGGTSGATPQVAAMATLINIIRYQEGKGPLGALTKTLYQLPKGIGEDVSLGRTYATNRSGFCKNQFMPGYFAAPGWDATTGLGVALYPTLKEQLVNVPGEANQS